jgi:hypothetical protein
MLGTQAQLAQQIAASAIHPNGLHLAVNAEKLADRCGRVGVAGAHVNVSANAKTLGSGLSRDFLGGGVSHNKREK